MSTEPAATAIRATQWWDDSTVLHRFISDLVIDEFRHLRPGRLGLPQRRLAGSARIDEDLGADSLELVSLATALTEAIHLHESGIEDYLLVRRTVAGWTDTAAQGLGVFSARLTFRTSGSSGMPKPCTHELAALSEEIGHLARSFQGRRRILTAVPCHHIYGFLFTILLPRALGIDSESVIDIRNMLPSALARKMQPGDLVIGHPEFWRTVARSIPAIKHDIIGVTSSGPCPDDVSDTVTSAGLVALYQIYGTSETAGIGWRRSRSEPYALFPYWSTDSARPGRLIRTHVDGRSQDMALQDQLDWIGPSTFNVGARLDDAVQVGGINVFPARVREILLRHPDVADASVRLMRPEEGSRLKAFVVPRPGVSHDGALYSALCDWTATHLPPVARPRAITFGHRVPRTAAGKTEDWPLDAITDTL